jgi:ParB family chromosome partitioning protein
VGKSRSAVTNTMRLLKLTDGVKRALLDGLITEGHARPLLELSTPQAQNAALQTILERGLTVRQTEELVRRLCGKRTPRPTRGGPDPEVTALEERLRSTLGTRVTLTRRGKGGTLLIHFYSDEELDSLVMRIAGTE